MRRKFINPAAQAIYDSCVLNRPNDGSAVSNAFRFGFDNPDADPTREQCGPAGGMLRAAWSAGVDCRRADDRAAIVEKGN